MRRAISFAVVFAACLLLIPCRHGSAQAKAGREWLKNPGFEAPYQGTSPVSDAANQKSRITGEIAEGWQDNSNWADVTIAYSRDTSHPHRGESCQCIAVSRVGSGACQFVQPVTLQKGHTYEFRIWLRGQAGVGVSVSLRQGGVLYTTYAETRADISPEWREFRVAGLASDDAAAFVMLRVEQPTTFWADNAQFVDMTQASANAAPTLGNLLTGGSFEAGVSAGWSVRFQGPMRHAFEDPRPRTDPTAAVGIHSLRADIPEGDSVEIFSPLFHFHFGRVHTATVWLKASQADTQVQMGIEGTDIAQNVTVGPQWQRFTLTGKMPFKDFARLRLASAAPDRRSGRTLWLDGAQVEERDTASPRYVPAAALELTLTLTRPGHVVFDGEKALVTIGVGPQPPRGARLGLTLENLVGQRRTLPGAALPKASFPLPIWTGRPLGVFKLTGVVLDAHGKALSAPVTLIWSRLPHPKVISPAQSYFGLHIPLSPYYIALARAVGARWVRLHDTSMIGKWAIAEPTPGHFEFHDAGVTAAHNAGLAILGMLDGAPAWATTKPREGGYWGLWNIPDKPNGPAQWEQYVRTVTGHYRGRIDAWEIWNEPWGEWWLSSRNPNATPQFYSRLMQIAYQTAKAANPSVQIVGVDTTRGFDDQWTDPVLKSSGPQFYDALSFHDYNDVLAGGPNNTARLQAEDFNKIQAKYGTPKPLWDTEGGLFAAGSFYAPETGGMPAQQEPAYIVRYDVTMMAAGVRRFFPYAVHTDPSEGNIETTLTEYDRAVKPFLAARAVLASLIDGAGRPTRSEPVPGTDLYTFPAQRGQYVSVLWSYDGQPHAFSLPDSAHALDIFGNVLSRRKTLPIAFEPIYLLRPQEKPMTKTTRLLRQERYHWGDWAKAPYLRIDAPDAKDFSSAAPGNERLCAVQIVPLQRHSLGRSIIQPLQRAVKKGWRTP